MPVQTQVKKVTINGNDSAIVHSFSPLVIYESSDIVVTLRTAAGVENTLSEGASSTTYSVGIINYPGTGSITYPASGGTPLAAGATLTIKRTMTLEQQTRLGTQLAYDPAVQEQQYDKLVFIDLQQQEELDRSVKVPVSYTGGATLELPEPEASTFLGWNADADAIINATAVATATVSTFMATVLDDLTALAARVTLGIGVSDDVTFNSIVVDRIDLDHTATENDDSAVELDVNAAGFGDVKALNIDYITGAISSGEDEAIILVNIDEILAVGGDIFGLEVLATDGGADNIYAVKAGAVVGPVLQESGTFANPTTGTNDTASTDVAAMIDGSAGTNTTIFVADDDYILIGAAAAFTEIEFVIETPAANPGIKPTFGYSITGSHQFTTFSPVDGTNGFRNTGVIAWDAADLTAHVANSDTGTFDIKITRTHASAGSVSLFYAKTAATVVYSWDKDGVVTVAELKAPLLSTVTSINGHGLWPDLNLLDNIEMLVDSRSGDTRTGLGASDVMLADRWELAVAGSASARWTASVETSGGPQTTAKWLKLLNTTADGSPGAAESHAIRQKIEARNCQALIAGDGSILAHRLSFRIIAHADGASSITFPANVGVSVRTADGTARQYVTDVAVAADATFEEVSIVVPVDATGTIDNNNGTGFEVSIGLYAGSSQQGTNATWENDDDARGTSSSDNFADATGNYIGFTQAHLEPGAAVTNFSHRRAPDELLRCARYTFGYTASGTNTLSAAGYQVSTTKAHFTLTLPAVLRSSSLSLIATAADFNVITAGGVKAGTAISLTQSGDRVIMFEVDWSGAIGAAGDAVRLDLTTGNTFIISADL